MDHAFFVRYMGYDEFILIVNSVSFIILLVIALMLCSAARFKGESSYAALFIFFTTLPDFIYNICDFFDWNLLAVLMAPVAYSVNLTLMPFMLLLAHRAFNPYYRFRSIRLLHFLPALFFGIVVAFHIRMMSVEEFMNFSVERVAGFRTFLTGVNFLMLSVQLVVYFYLIFSYLRKVKLYIFNNQSQADLADKVWVPRFITFVGFLVIVAMVGSHFDPLGGFRLFYFINLLAMGYLLYSELQLVFAVRNHRVPTPIAVADAEADYITPEEIQLQPSEMQSSKEELQKLQHYARQVEEYLRTSEVYVNPNLSLKDVATATGISSKNLSKSINAVLDKNFFDLVNGFRIEKSKALLLAKKEKGLTLETIAEQCGFNSRVTFNNAFKKVIGLTTTEWLRLNQHNSNKM